MSTEHSVAQHYSHGSLEQAILDGLAAAGKNPDALSPEDLAPVDEFHIGGRRATADFAAEFAPRPGMHLIDIGSGLGGASRYFATQYGCRITGIDLTEEYVEVAQSLARRTGLDGVVSYRQASALALPFADASFDGGYMFHVGMNIADKAKLFVEARRVLKPGATFGLFDVMREGPGEILFPVPWSSGPETSFVETADNYKRLLVAAQFHVVRERSRRDFAIESYKRLRAYIARSGPPPLGRHIMFGPAASQMSTNLLAMLEQGTLAPVEIICRAD
jgi:ubiquinone/menaquinone biosynthesis C-methylase UbiE